MYHCQQKNPRLRQMQNHYPVYWINLNRDIERRHRMTWALETGGWEHYRWEGVDATDLRQKFWPLPRLWQAGTALPGLRRKTERDPFRSTARTELACLASWQTLLEYLNEKKTLSDWFLVMEDDVGSSLACPDSWPFSLSQLVKSINKSALVVQLAPISSNARIQLHSYYTNTNGEKLAIPKMNVKSHGNGAVLINGRALPFLQRHLGKWIHNRWRHIHLLSHPHATRPVADKWLYACIPANRCWVCTYPIFCLEAKTSNIHQKHVDSYHSPSKLTTRDIWKEDQASLMIESFRYWETIQ